jgi:hypothetical protein
VRPRLFSESADELNKEVKIEDECFAFLFHKSNTENPQSLERVIVKDLTESVRNLDKFVMPRLRVVMKVLEMTLGEPQIKANLVACQ